MEVHHRRARDSSPAVGADGTIYVGSFDQNLYAIKPGGTQKWRFTTGGFVFSSPAVGADGTIFVGSMDQNLYAIKPDGTQKWKFATVGGISSRRLWVRTAPSFVSGGNFFYAVH